MRTEKNNLQMENFMAFGKRLMENVSFGIFIGLSFKATTLPKLKLRLTYMTGLPSFLNHSSE